jgi:hypothetical protein
MLLPSAAREVAALHRAWQQEGAGRGGLPSLADLSLEWGLLAAASVAAVLDGAAWRGRQVAKALLLMLPGRGMVVV